MAYRANASAERDQLDMATLETSLCRSILCVVGRGVVEVDIAHILVCYLGIMEAARAFLASGLRWV